MLKFLKKSSFIVIVPTKSSWKEDVLYFVSCDSKCELQLNLFGKLEVMAYLPI